MIRKLIENDRTEVLEFLYREPSINLFMIGDIEGFGFHEDFQTLWGQYSEDGVLEGVLLRFHESYIPYFTDPEFDITEFGKIILNNNGQIMLSGKESLIKKFEEVLPEHKIKSMYFCELTSQESLMDIENSGNIKIAAEEDAERVYNLIEQIEEFQAVNSVERIKHKINTRTGRIYYVENEEGEMVSVAQTSAENSKSAMIVGVATLPGYRCNGYMSMCLRKLCMNVMSEGRSLCLFYDNPNAGSIYHRLGFKSIDNWAMVSLDLEECRYPHSNRTSSGRS